MENPKKNQKQNESIVVEFNLSKAIMILIAIILIISTITTVKIIKTHQDSEITKTFANEENNVDENDTAKTESTNQLPENDTESTTSENETETNIETTTVNNVESNIQLLSSTTQDIVYISLNSNTVSLEDSGKTKVTIKSVFSAAEVTADNLTIEWIANSTDGGNVEVKTYGNNLYVYGTSVGTVELKAKATYNGTTIESNTVTITVKSKLDDYYQRVTLFNYDSVTLFESGGSVVDTSSQGIYFTDGATVPGTSQYSASVWNSWNASTPNTAYTGLVESSLDADGNIIFTKPAYGIFDTTTTLGKEIYTDIGLPFKALGDGFYQFNSDEVEVNFGGQTPQSGMNLVSQDTKNTYVGLNLANFTGFFPFNYQSGESAVYHFGMHTQIPFYMTEDGKSNVGEGEDVVFEFTGDDDIWIFVDGELVLDLGGIHNAISADINFATGVATTYYGLKSTNKIAKTQKLTDILGTNWNDDITTQHTLDIFYLERGAGASNCTMSFNMPLEVQTSEVVIHHYIDGTTQKIIPDETIEGNNGDMYIASPSKNIPAMYEVVEEKRPENAIGIFGSADNQDVIYYYKLKENSTIQKTGTTEITSLTQNAEYNISYTGAIKDYTGVVIVKVVDYLPLKIDETLSNIDNGVYDENELTITWRGLYDTTTDTLNWDNQNASANEDVTIKDDGNILISKDISLIFEDIPLDGTKISNRAQGTLETKTGLSETVEDSSETALDFKVKISVEKIWQGDFETDRPEEVTIKLLTNDEENGETIQLNKENGWTESFNNLNKYDDQRNEITYTIEEVVPNGYYISNQEKSEIEKGEKYVITNFKYAQLQITKVAEENNNIQLSGTEFKLYRLIGNDSAKTELIDKENVSSDWEFVNTYVTGNDGIINLADLVKTSEYRLVETKASENRIVADGQWQLEFIYGDYDENDETIKNIDGTLVRISAVGNPPAFVISKTGKLLIPNKQYFELPQSGGNGTKMIYQTGIAIILIGIIIFMYRKYPIIINKEKQYKRKLNINIDKINNRKK